MTLKLEHRGAARIVRFDRPAQRNAIDRAMVQRLVEAAREIRRDRDARGVVFCGTDGFFSAGGDLREFAEVERSSRGARDPEARARVH